MLADFTYNIYHTAQTTLDLLVEHQENLLPLSSTLCVNGILDMIFSCIGDK